MKMTNSEIVTIKKYFQDRSDVAFAFLYGSQANGTATKLSDVDIAVYFYPPQRHPIECEEPVCYAGENEIWRDLEQLLHKEVELLVLNRASSLVAASAIRGIPLAIHDWGLYLDFMVVITDIATDFAELVILDYNERTALENSQPKPTGGF